MGSFIRQNSFAGGVMGEPWWGRDDLDRYKTSARNLLNYIITKSGTLLNRPGTEYVANAYSQTKKSWLERFDFSGYQTYMLEFSDLKLKVYNAQKTVQNQGIPAIIVTLARGESSVQISANGGVSWRAVALPGAANALCKNGTTRYCAVGMSTCYTSDDDGETWTPGAFAAMTANAICWTGTKFVAVGQSGKFSSSADGITWAFAGTTSTTADWMYVAFGNTNQVVATGIYAIAPSTFYVACSVDSGGTFPTVTAVSAAASGWSASKNSAPVWTGSRWVFGLTFTKFSSPLYWLDPRVAVATTGTGAWTVTAMESVNARTISPPAPPATCVWTGSVGYLTLPSIGTESREWTFDAAATFTSLSTGLLVYSLFMLGSVAAYQPTSSKSIYARSGSLWVLLGTSSSYTNGGVAGGGVSVVTTTDAPYLSADLPYLRAVQSGDTLFMFCRGYSTYKVVRSGGGVDPLIFTWSLAAADAPTTVGPMPSLSGAFLGADAQHPTKEWSWVVSWVDADGKESLQSVAYTSSVAVCYPDKFCKIQWTGIEGAAEYYIFRGRDGVYGLVGFTRADGTVATSYFTDEGQIPDLSIIPRMYTDILTTDAPAVGAFYQDRLMVANTPLLPNTVRGSTTSDYLNFDKLKFQREDSPIEFSANSRRYEEVRALVGMRELVVLTSESEGSLSGTGGDPLTFKSVDYKTHSKRGCGWVEPQVIGDVCLYVERDGQAVRDLAYNVNTDSYGTNELTMFVDNLLAGSGRSIIDWAYAQHPYSTLWIVLSDGKVLSLSYIPELKQVAWAEHDLGGTVETVASIWDGSEDTPWFVVVRGGVRQIERLTSRNLPTVSLAVQNDCFLDDAKFFAAPGSVTLTTHHVNGTVVYAFADGVIYGPFTINANHQITVASAAYARIWVGRLITYDFESLDLAEGRERKKTVTRVVVNITNAPSVAATGAVVQAGKDLSNLNPVGLVSLEEGSLELLCDTDTNPGGRCAIRIAAPVPIEINSISREIAGGR